MTILPIIERELRVRARSRGAYWMRFAAGLTAALVCLPQLLLPRPFAGSAAPGPGLLNALVSAAFLLCCGACLLAADVISSERREGTLGLLLLTPVRTLDVLAGKLGSAGLTGLCVLLALLPLLMIPVLAGGVTGGEAFRKGLVLPDTLFLALAAGLWASADAQERLKAARNALVMVAILVLAPGLAELLLRGGGTPGAKLGLLSPLGAISAATAGQYAASAADYWTSLVLVQAVGWVLLLGAGLRLRRAWREDRGETVAFTPAPVGAGAKEPDGPWLSCSWTAPTVAPAGDGETPAAPIAPRPLRDGANPIAWLLQRQRGTRAILWAGALVSFTSTWLPAVIFHLWRPTSVWALSMPWDLARSALQGALFAWAASRFLVEARRTGELELLLTTPAGASQLVSTQWAVLKRLLRWPMLVMLVPPILGPVSILTMNRVWLGPNYAVFRLNYVINELFYCVNVFFGVGALCWLGLWFGLRAGTQGGAIAWTVGVVKGLPYLLGVLSWMLFSALGAYAFSGGSPVGFLVVRSLPQMVDLLFYLTLIHVARRRLLGELGGADPIHLDLRQAVSAAARDALAAARNLRHWTPHA